MKAGVPEIFFNSEVALGSYILICKDPNDGIGYIVHGIKENANNPQKKFDEIIKRNPVIKNILKDADIIKEIYGTLYVNNSLSNDLIFNNTINVGDSALLMDPLLHYGVRAAIISGYEAGKNVGDYIINGNEMALKNYEAKINDIFFLELKDRLRYRKIFDRLTDTDIERIFTILKEVEKTNIDIDMFFENPYRNLLLLSRMIIKNPSLLSLLPKFIYI